MIEQYFPVVNYGGYNSSNYSNYGPYVSSNYGGYSSPYYGGYANNYQPNYYDFGYGDSYYDDANYDDGYYGDNGYYGNDGYYGDNRSSWKEGLLRTLLSLVFGGVNGGYNNGDYGNGGYYNQPAYAGYSQPYGSPAYSQQYGNYPNYSPVGYSQQPYYGSPYQDVVYSNGYERELIERAAASGYSQGYTDGQNAARYGYTDYYDPYSSGNGAYDNYSVSIDERQQLLSEGYELGYRDAAEQRDVYGINNGGGTMDLVSVLLQNVLLNGSI